MGKGPFESEYEIELKDIPEDELLNPFRLGNPFGAGMDPKGGNSNAKGGTLDPNYGGGEINIGESSLGTGGVVIN